MPNEQTPLATVAGKNIYPNDLNELIQTLPTQQQMFYRSREGRKLLLEELIAQNLMYEEALENRINEEEEFQALVRDAEEKLLKTFSIANFMKGVDKVTEDEMKKFYDENPDQFVSPETVRASHILVHDEKEAERILKEIQDGEITFEEAAKKYSIDPSSQNGGDLQYFARGQMVPEFEEVAFKLNPGEISSEPVKTQFGYHLIKTTDKKEPETVPYILVKDSLKDYLTMQKQDQAFKKHIEELKEKYPVEINLGTV